MKTLVNRLRSGGSKNLLIIGDVMLDVYHFGSVSRISPEAPVPVLLEEREEWSLGGAANVAANCQHIGCNVTLIGVIGHSDREGAKFVELLNEIQISSQGIVRSTHRCTTAKKRFLAKSHQMLRMDAEVTRPLTDEESVEVKRRIADHMIPGSMVLVSDYAKGVISSSLIHYICCLARERACTVLADPKGPNFSKYEGVTFLKPNLKEFKQIVAYFNLPADRSVEENGREICHMLKLEGLIVTEGERGISYITPHEYMFSPAFKREVYDLTGAGDTVIAFLALGLANQFTMEDCLRLANCAASVAISHVKTYAVSLDELIDREAEPTEKIYHDWAALKIELDWLRADGKRVVFTNGCFDIVHPGHIHVLKEAKKQGDILVVALNTDSSIQRLKGADRPVNVLADRATVIAAIGGVDFVVSFDQDTPHTLISYLKPDVIVKGGDYKREAVVGYDIVTSYGGTVHIVDLVQGVSTTRVINKVSQSPKNNRYQQGVEEV